MPKERSRHLVVRTYNNNGRKYYGVWESNIRVFSASSKAEAERWAQRENEKLVKHKDRPCLTCGEVFRSTGAHHRLCMARRRQGADSMWLGA